jgi:hypothetical protein
MKKLVVAIAIVFTANAVPAQSSGPTSMYFGGSSESVARCAHPGYIVKCEQPAVFAMMGWVSAFFRGQSVMSPFYHYTDFSSADERDGNLLDIITCASGECGNAAAC